MNSHRSGWDGTICRHASSWDCSATSDFREDYCAHGTPRCFHLHTFDPSRPGIGVHSSGGNWIFDRDLKAIDDQILLLWGREFREPNGVPSGRAPDFHVFGAYRVKEVRRIELSHRIDWEITPHADGWVRLAGLRLPVPRYRGMSGKYFQQVEAGGVQRLFESAREKVKGRMHSWNPEDLARFEAFCKSLPAWLEHAASKAPAPREVVSEAREGDREWRERRETLAPRGGHRPFKNLGEQVKTLNPTLRSAPVSSKPSTSVAGSSGRRELPPLISPTRHAELERRHGREVLTALLLGSISKPLLVLRGAPGVGKSHMAVRLTAEGTEDRTLVIPVGATWRGREDLLGYVNPIDNVFEPTEFTRFLIKAERAWQTGDRKPHVVVFEEFNLSQPEHWMSDLLVRSQFAWEPKEHRMIQLGGKQVRDGGASEVFLSPAVRFVATINSDHTTRSLSPRVLDRAAVVSLSLEPSDCLKRLGLDLEEEQVEAISELDFRIKKLGAGFSYRTALSLQVALERLELLALDSWGALDLVLAQEVLSKVQLLAMDSTDHHSLTQLLEWSEGPGARLPVCGRMIAAWRDALEAGQDVQQA